ncbi:phosphoribosylglycinamide formyltransferase [Rhodohalobacter sp. 8-1]|uniref:phosphoribosylglycinamide formyltransferase n=1 Tax=Rhodohalobacter sp. 8-1 TaxID=3131972 RepID=UPI0030EEA2EA
MHNLVFFASGSGTNFQSVINAIQCGRLDAKISGLIADRPGAGAIERAEENNIPTYVLDLKRTDSDKTLLSLLSDLDPDLIVLAGFLKKIPDIVIDKYRGRIINIHPSLLPKYGGKGYFGLNVHRAVIENREKVSGCTVHFVDEVYDNGSVIEQIEVPVSQDDTPESLAKKILQEEHNLLPKTIRKLLTQTSN